MTTGPHAADEAVRHAAGAGRDVTPRTSNGRRASGSVDHGQGPRAAEPDEDANPDQQQQAREHRLEVVAIDVGQDGDADERANAPGMASRSTSRWSMFSNRQCDTAAANRSPPWPG